MKSNNKYIYIYIYIYIYSILAFVMKGERNFSQFSHMLLMLEFYVWNDEIFGITRITSS